MLLAIDVGNTRIKAGVWSDGRWIRLESAPTNVDGLESLAASGIADGVEQGVCASVVPSFVEPLQDGFPSVKFEFLTGRSSGLSSFLDYDSRDTLGADRIANALALRERVPGPGAAVSIDLGTATKFDVVTYRDGQGAFRGGAIMPGLGMSARSLNQGTAQLPEVTLDAPEHVVGRDTKACMQSGVLYGHAASVDGMIERIWVELGQEPTVFVTGGYAQLILPLCRMKATHAPNLTLEGLAVAHRILSR